VVKVKKKEYRKTSVIDLSYYQKLEAKKKKEQEITSYE